MKDYYEHIEEYINGSLSQEENAEFETAMSKDSNLSEAVKNFHLAKKLSASLIEYETRQFLKTLKAKPNGNNLYKYLAVVFILAMIISVYFLLLQEKKPVAFDEKQIFAQLYETPASIASRNERLEYNTLDSAIQFFDHGKLENSKVIFLSYYQMDSTNLKVIRYLAHIYLLQSNYLKSENLFNKLLVSGSANQKDEAEYNLIIIYLLQNKKDQAQKLFDNLKLQKSISEEKLKLIHTYLNN